MPGNPMPGARGVVPLHLLLVPIGLLIACPIVWAQAPGQVSEPEKARAPVQGGGAQAESAGVAATPPGELGAALAKVREGKLNEALDLIKQQALRHPEWPPARLLLARLLFTADQQVMGRRVLEQAAADTADHPEVYLSLGSLALSDGRLSDGWLNFNQARRLIGGGRFSEEVAGRYQRECHEGLAAVAEAREQWKVAQAELKASLELDPKNAVTRQKLGRILFRQGQTDDAFKELEQAAKESPQIEPAGVSMAWLYAQKGDATKAAEWFDYAIKAEPQNPRPRLAHAAWLIDQGKAKEADAEVDAALRLNPQSSDAQRMKGLAAWHNRQLQLAETTLEPLYRDQPSNLLVANLYALALIDQDDPVKRSRGLKVAESIARAYPRSSEALATVGWACYRLGKLDQAEQILRASVSNTRATPDMAYYLARVLIDKTQLADAGKLLESALNTPGWFAHRQDALTLLKSLKKS